MKQIILKKTEVDYHRAWYDTDGAHFAHDKNELMEEADRQIRLKGIEDIWYVYSMKETEDKKRLDRRLFHGRGCQPHQRDGGRRMSAYGEFKKRNVMYVAYLFVRGYGVVDFNESLNLLNAIEGYEDLVREAQDHKFGDGIYEVTLRREYFDEKGRLVKSDLFRRFVNEWGVTR